MKILVACEESQAVTIEMRRLGHEAYSCDIIECSGGHPEWHILGDALKILESHDIMDVAQQDRCRGIEFCTMDEQYHFIEKWDLLIAHPPCTFLSNAGATRLYKKINGKSYVELERLNKGFDAKEFFLKFLNAPINKIAVENPIPSGVYRLPKYSQVIQPYEYGHPYSKKTCLWLKGLPPLEPTEIVKPICSWVSGGSKKADGTPRENQGTTFRDSKRRSKTFYGIAKAMAEQWAGVCEKEADNEQ